jgi:hypothetical protein
MKARYKKQKKDNRTREGMVRHKKRRRGSPEGTEGKHFTGRKRIPG